MFEGKECIIGRDKKETNNKRKGNLGGNISSCEPGYQ